MEESWQRNTPPNTYQIYVWWIIYCTNQGVIRLKMLKDNSPMESNNQLLCGLKCWWWHRRHLGWNDWLILQEMFLLPEFSLALHITHKRTCLNVDWDPQHSAGNGYRIDQPWNDVWKHLWHTVRMHICGTSQESWTVEFQYIETGDHSGAVSCCKHELDHGFVMRDNKFREIDGLQHIKRHHWWSYRLDLGLWWMMNSFPGEIFLTDELVLLVLDLLACRVTSSHVHIFIYSSLVVQPLNLALMLRLWHSINHLCHRVDSQQSYD